MNEEEESEERRDGDERCRGPTSPAIRTTGFGHGSESDTSSSFQRTIRKRRRMNRMPPIACGSGIRSPISSPHPSSTDSPPISRFDLVPATGPSFSRQIQPLDQKVSHPIRSIRTLAEKTQLGNCRARDDYNPEP